MKTMPLLLALGITVATVVAGYGEQHRELTMGFWSGDPNESADWASATGFDVQARFWNSSHMGWALALGAQTWEARTEYTIEEDEFGSLATWIEGDTLLVPAGLSVLLCGHLGSHVSLLADLGVRYAFADSGINATVEAIDSGGQMLVTQQIGVEDTVLGVVGLALEARLTPEVAFEAGIGCQFDLLRPREDFLGEDIGSTSFQALYARIGMSLSF